VRDQPPHTVAINLRAAGQIGGACLLFSPKGAPVSTEPQPSTQTPAPRPALDPQLDPPPQGQTTEAQTAQTQPAQTQPPTQQVPLPQHKIRPTRTSGLWLAIGFFALILLFLLIFILENDSKVSISFLGAHGHLPLGVALLLAAVSGVLLTVLAGAARMAQLHSVARRHRRADARRVTAATTPVTQANPPTR
jgi:lipopolysaccharide assembly protein A